MLGHVLEPRQVGLLLSWSFICKCVSSHLFTQTVQKKSAHIIADLLFDSAFLLSEKEKRVKAGSDGEGANNSQSDSSASLGSLKGAGESRLALRHPCLQICATTLRL